MPYYRIITQDLYGIAGRLKEIDRGYFAVYNPRKSRYEIHHKGQKNTFCLAVPYDILDERTLRLVRRTRAERARELYEEIERENARIKREELYKLRKETENVIDRSL